MLLPLRFQRQASGRILWRYCQGESSSGLNETERFTLKKTRRKVSIWCNCAVKISRISSETGKETVIEVESRESFFGISSLLHASERGEQAIALERSQIMEWNVADLDKLIARTPQLGPSLMRMVAQKLVEADRRIESFANDHIPRRLVKALLRLGQRFGENDGSSKIRLMPLTHELLARHVGTSREIVTQHMSVLRRQGLLDYSRAGLEFDPDKLRRELDQIR